MKAFAVIWLSLVIIGSQAVASIELDSSPHVTVTLPIVSYDLAWGDFDGDADLDLAAAGYGVQSIIYRNDGPGFTARWFSDMTTDNTAGIALGDFDLDGDMDWACANASSRNLVYWQIAGELCSVAAGTCWQSGAIRNSYGVAAGDFNNDGYLDLAFANNRIPYDACSVYLFNASALNYPLHPSWMSSDVYAGRAVAVGDVNNDGWLDLVIGCMNQPDLVFFNNQGSLMTVPGWSTSASEPTTSVALGDYDHDGDLDLVCGHYLTQSVLYRNYGVGFEAAPVWTSLVVEKTVDVAWGDADGDADLDLAFADAEGTCSVYECLGGVSYSPYPEWQVSISQASAVAWGDYDNDRDLDLAVATYSSRIALYRNQSGVLTKMPLWISEPSSQSTSCLVMDVDNDHDFDVMDGSLDDQLSLYTCTDGSLDSTPSWSSSPAFGSQVLVMATEAMIGSAFPDVAVGTEVGVSLFENVSGAFGDLPLVSTPFTFRCTGLHWTDLNLDANPDLVAIGEFDPIRLFENSQGTFTFSQYWESLADYPATGIVCADLNGDGFSELAITTDQQDDSAVMVFHNDNGQLAQDPTWWTQWVAAGQGLASADLTGTGFPDVILSVSDGRVVVLGNQAGTLNETPIWQTSSAEDCRALLLWDLDQTGTVDLLVGRYQESNQLYLNRAGLLSAVPDWSTTTQFKTTALTLCDPDLDGDYDVYEANYGARNSLYLNRTTSAPLLPEILPWFVIEQPPLLVTDTLEIRYRLFGSPYVTYSIDVQYSPSGGGQWFTATCAGGSGLTQVEASLSGIDHTVFWQIRADIPETESEGMILRFKANPEAYRVGLFHQVTSWYYTLPFRCHARPLMLLMYPQWHAADNQDLLVQYLLHRRGFNPRVVFTRTSGAPDPYSPHQVTQQLIAYEGLNAVMIDGLDLNNDGGVTVTDVLVDGCCYEVVLTARDIHGLQGTSLVRDWTFDLSAPSTEVTYPPEDGYAHGLPLTVTGTCSDSANGAGISIVRLMIEGQAVAVEGTATWSADWYPPREGAFTLTAWGEDLAGNIETPGITRTFWVDNQGPTLSFTTPSSGECIVGTASYVISGTADDGATGSGIASVALSFDSGATWIDAQGTEQWSYDWPVPGPGGYIIWARATDVAGNEGARTQVYVYRDTTPPSVVIVQPRENEVYGPNLVVQGTASDQISTIEEVEISLDAGQWQPAAGTTQWQLSMTDLAEGEHRINVKARDSCDNTTNPAASVKFRVDHAGPEILVGGYLYSRLASDQPFAMTIVAYTEDPDVSSMDLSIAGVFVGSLNDRGVEGDFVAADGLFAYSLTLGELCLAGGEFLLEIVALDNVGNRSAPWPYLKIHEQAQNRPCSTPPIERLLQPALRSLRTGARQTSGAAPYILAAGYWGSDLSVEAGGDLRMYAFVDDPQGLTEIAGVEVLYGGQPTGIYLQDNGAGFYGVNFPIPAAALPADLYLLQLQAADWQGHRSEVWPYMVISEETFTIIGCEAFPSRSDLGPPIRFTCEHSGGRAPFTYAWNFGDGATSTEKIPTHNYTAYGTYPVSVSVTDCIGQNAVCQTSADISPCQGGLEVFCDASPRQGEAPLNVQFSASARCGTPPYSYAWDFGDGAAGSGDSTAHTYTRSGSYNACVTVADQTTSQQCCLTINVGVAVVTCSAEADPQQGPPPLTVRFSSTVQGGQAPYSYTWNFGDGGSSTEASPTYTYVTQGVYEARMQVIDSVDTTCTSSIQIVVQESRITDHVISYPSGSLVLSTVTLQGVTNGDRLEWEWLVEGAVCSQDEVVLSSGTSTASVSLDPVAQCGAASGTTGLVKLSYNGIHFPGFDRTFTTP